jgi:hypothetical protein
VTLVQADISGKDSRLQFFLTLSMNKTELRGNAQTLSPELRLEKFYEQLEKGTRKKKSIDALRFPSEKYIAYRMLHKTRIKCCVRTYTTYFNIELLLVHLYAVQKSNTLLKNYTTYKSVLHKI